MTKRGGHGGAVKLKHSALSRLEPDTVERGGRESGGLITNEGLESKAVRPESREAAAANPAAPDPDSEVDMVWLEMYEKRIRALEASVENFRHLYVECGTEKDALEADLDNALSNVQFWAKDARGQEERAEKAEAALKEIYHANPAGSRPIIHPRYESCFLCSNEKEE